jgi:hypothetical protein
MRVTIDHREEATGLSGKGRNYFVDCAVEFSEEEKAIIQARGLFDHGFAMPAAEPMPSQVAYVGSGVIRTIGRLLIVVAVVWGIVLGLSGQGEGPTAFLLFLGIGLEIYGWIKSRGQDKRIEQPEQAITLRKLMSGSGFTVHALDPAQAKAIDDQIRNELAGLKALIAESAEVRSRQTFEL